MSYAEILSMKYQGNSDESAPIIDIRPATSGKKFATHVAKSNTSSIEERQRNVPPGEQNTESLVKTEDVSMQTTFLRKLKDMERKQEELQRKHAQLQQEQKKQRQAQQTNSNLAENTINERTINDIIDKKMEVINNINETRLKEMETKIKKDVGEAIEKNADNISVKVANHVASQLVGLFHQYMTPREQHEHTPTLTVKPAPPLLTQEWITPQKLTTNSTEINSTENIFQSNGNCNTKMLEAINEIDTTIQRSCSTHDNSYEQTEPP